MPGEAVSHPAGNGTCNMLLKSSNSMATYTLNPDAVTGTWLCEGVPSVSAHQPAQLAAGLDPPLPPTPSLTNVTT